MRLRSLAGLMMVSFPLLVSCDSPVKSREPGWMHASISGPAVDDYVGSGEFLDQRNREEGPRRMFWLDSQSDAARTQEIGFYRYNGTRPRPGRYPLQIVGPSNDHKDVFAAGHRRWRGEVYELYTATDGYVEITFSSDERVEGTFYFVGRRFCALPRTGGTHPCPYPWQPPADAPTIEVNGSFSAVPEEDEEAVSLTG